MKTQAYTTTNKTTAKWLHDDNLVNSRRALDAQAEELVRAAQIKLAGFEFMHRNRDDLSAVQVMHIQTQGLKSACESHKKTFTS